MDRTIKAVAWLALAALLHAEDAGAEVTQVVVNPDSTTIPAGQVSSLAVTWRVTSTPDVAGLGGGGAAVTSAGGEFRANDPGGAIIGTNAQPLTGVAQGPAGQPGIATVIENLAIPLGVLQQAVNLGATRIVYLRGFTDPTPVRGRGMVASIVLELRAPLQASVMPAVASTAAGQATTVSVTWRVSGSGPGGRSVSSPRGEFLAGGPAGQPIGGREFSLQSEARAVGGSFTALLRETIEIPVQVVLRAQQLNANRIAYRRTFTSGTAEPETAVLLLNLSGPLGGAFGINGVALRFGDGSRQSVIDAGGDLVAIADVAHTGTGRLEAVWEVAEPSSTRSVPIFRSLDLVRRQLVRSGSSTLLRSPPLPTGTEGAYLVRLRLTSPEPAFEPPVMRYFVNPAGDRSIAPALIGAISPAVGAAHAPGTRFSWQPLAGAASYRLELHDAAGAMQGTDPAMAAADLGEPRSGIAVDAGITDTELSRLALSHLPPGRSYWWRVLAYDELGRVVGASEPRRLYVPPAESEP